MPRMTHFLLLQCRTDTPAGLAQAASQWCANSPVPLALHRVARQGETGAVYAYARLLSPCALSPSDLSACLRAWPSQESKVHAATVSRLALALDAPGISSAVQPVFHYVVEMDPEAGWQKELFDWYDTEHMPGLAAVPGCIHARRLLNHDHGPLSLACYDLVSDATLGSVPWLAVRNTAWSDRVRPHFTHTRRTMMEVLA